ncbi:MAG: hypothetical protein EON51_14930 [Acinetobacter sp.]|nr:MAG: hypothetical protein EON51_14930 [Acinetobacter sp.]
MKKITLFIVMVALFAACKNEIAQLHPNKKGNTIDGGLMLSSGMVLSNDSAFNTANYAGSGTAGSSNGSSLLTAQFDAPEGLVFDSNGNLFVADRDNHVIRKITPSGTVSVFAGVVGVTGAQNGALGTGKFFSPIRLAIDDADNLYVADRDNSRIRKVSPAGVISTIAGNTAGTGSTQFNWPIDVAVTGDGTKVYVADSKNHRIQKVTLSGGVWTTSLLAGSTTADYQNGTGSAARFNYPSGVALDNSGNIIVADRMNNCVRKVTTGGVVTLLAGVPELLNPYSLDAPRLKAKMGEPFGVTVANDGCIYITDIYFHTIRRLNAEGFLSTVAGTGSAGATNGDFASFNIPTTVVIDNAGNFYVADINNNKIRKMAPTDRTLQYTHGWNVSTPHPGVTWYYFSGNRFFLPSTQTNEIQYVNVLDIDLTVNNIDFKQVDSIYKNTLTNIIGPTTSAVAALSGTFATVMPSPSGPNKKYTAFLRNNDVTYWNCDIYNTSSYWVYHEGMFYMNSDGSMGMEASNMSQNPFSPTLKKYMMSGAPLLIANSTIVEKTSSPAWASINLQEHIRESLASRSVLAIPTINNHLLLIVAEGKVPGTTYCTPVPRGFGMTTPDLAQFVKRYFNAKGALNLDGGGSASMCLKGHGESGGGNLGVISNPALAGTTCPVAHTSYSNQRTYMQDAIVVFAK